MPTLRDAKPCLVRQYHHQWGRADPTLPPETPQDVVPGRATEGCTYCSFDRAFISPLLMVPLSLRFARPRSKQRHRPWYTSLPSQHLIGMWNFGQVARGPWHPYSTILSGRKPLRVVFPLQRPIIHAYAVQIASHALRWHRVKIVSFVSFHVSCCRTELVPQSPQTSWITTDARN